MSGRVNGTGSEVSLPKLTTITGDTTHPGSLTTVQALSGGDIELPVLVLVNGGPVLLRSNGAGGKLDIPKLTEPRGLRGPGQRHHAPGRWWWLHRGHRPQNHSRGRRAGLGGISTHSRGPDQLHRRRRRRDVPRSMGPNSLLSLPALTTITTDRPNPALSEVEAINGGDIQLPVLDKVSGGPVLFRSNGTGGKLDIGTLTSGSRVPQARITTRLSRPMAAARWWPPP